MKGLSISDSHNLHHLLDLDLSGVDMLVHAGDFSSHISPFINHNESIVFLDWFSNLPVKYKILIPGNHETAWYYGSLGKISENWDIITLNNESVTIEGINIYGSPTTPAFGTGWAFNSDPDGIKNYWREIPRSTNLLITHCPPYGVLDSVPVYGSTYKSCGCKHLMKRVKSVNPDVMIFGHLHNDGGKSMQLPNIKTKFINASVVDEDYKMRYNKGVYFEL